LSGASLLGFAQLHPKKLVENQFVLQAASNPKGLLKQHHSKSSYYTDRFPPKEPPLAEGSKRVKSSADLEIVGKAVIFSTYGRFCTCSPLPNF
jgi:hypothetical protein